MARSCPSWGTIAVAPAVFVVLLGGLGSAVGAGAPGGSLVPLPEHPAMTASLSFDPNAVEVDTGSSLVSVTVSGGTAPYNYTYAGLPPGCHTQNASGFYCTPTGTGSFKVYVYVNDSSYPRNFAVGEATLTVVPMTATLSFSPTLPAVGEVLSVSTTVSGGALPYNYTYAGLPPGCYTQNSSYLSCSLSEAGSFQVYVYVNDSSYPRNFAVGEANLTVDPMTVALSLSPNQVELGAGISVSATVTGGVGPYNYTYTGLPQGGGCHTQNTSGLYCTPTRAGSFKVHVYVNDSSYPRNFAVGEANLTVDPMTATLSLNPTSLTSGESELSVNAQVTGGFQPYSYTYKDLPPECESQNQSMFSCVPSGEGTYTVHLLVNDSSYPRNTATATAELTVAPMTVTLSTSPSGYVVVGENLQVNAQVNGGVFPVSYMYTGLPVGCTSQNSSSFGCDPSQVGRDTVHVFVNDSSYPKDRAIGTVNLTVNASLAISAFTFTPSTAVVGTTVNITVNVSGGAPPYSFSYNNLPGGCSSQDKASFTCVPTGSCTECTASVSVHDTAGGSQQANVQYSVYSSSAQLLSLSVSATPESGPPPLTVTFSSEIQAGQGPYEMVWWLGDGSPSFWQNCSGPPCPTFQHTYHQQGKFMVEAGIKDSSSPPQYKSAYLNVTVGSGGSSGGLEAEVSCTPSTGSGPPSGTAPLTVSCQAIASGGTPPYAYQWTIANSTRISSAWLNYTFQNPGDYYVNLTITDAKGAQWYGGGIVKVYSGTGSGTGGIGSGGPLDLGAPGGVPTLFILLAAVGIVAASFASLALARRRRSALLEAVPPAAAASTSPAPETGTGPPSAPTPPTTASRPLSPATTAEPAPAAPPPPPPEARCRSCGAELEEGAGFCDNCGKAVG